MKEMIKEKVFLGIQMHNITNPMCNNCKNFLFEKSPYFKYGEGGYFVGADYCNLYQNTLKNKQSWWKMFMNVSIAEKRRGCKQTTIGKCYNNFLGTVKQDNEKSKKDFLQQVMPRFFVDIAKEVNISFIVCTHGCKDGNMKYNEVLKFEFEEYREA